MCRLIFGYRLCLYEYINIYIVYMIYVYLYKYVMFMCFVYSFKLYSLQEMGITDHFETTLGFMCCSQFGLDEFE